MIVYKATNIINDKCYIGQTIFCLDDRKYNHFYNTFTLKIQRYFYNAIRKHGKDNFKWEILCECDTKDELDDMEFHYIKQYHSHGINGYNLTDGGERGNFGYKHSDETKDKISKKLSGRIFSNETKEKMSKSHIGKKLSNKTRDKMSIIRKGKNVSNETRDKMSKALKGRISTRKLKTYIIIYPNNMIIKTSRLRDFCVENNLTISNMFKVINGERKHHKGFKCKEYKWT